MLAESNKAAELAKEITIASLDRIKHVDTSDPAAMNQSLAKEISKFYDQVFDTVRKSLQTR